MSPGSTRRQDPRRRTLVGRGRSRRRPRGAAGRADQAVAALRDAYPEARCALVHRSALQLLVATILSAQCTDARVNLVTPTLFERYPTATDLAGARIEDLEEIVRSTGFFHAKALAIAGMAQDLVSRFGGEVPATMADLVTLRGVGRKTANVVLGVAFDIPGLPVDTHVTRLAQRLRLTAADDPVGIEADLCELVPSDEWTSLSLRLIEHGRAVCVARSPRCGACVMNQFCPSSTVPVTMPAPAPPLAPGSRPRRSARR